MLVEIWKIRGETLGLRRDRSPLTRIQPQSRVYTFLLEVPERRSPTLRAELQAIVYRSKSRRKPRGKTRENWFSHSARLSFTLNYTDLNHSLLFIEHANRSFAPVENRLIEHVREDGYNATKPWNAFPREQLRLTFRQTMIRHARIIVHKVSGARILLSSSWRTTPARSLVANWIGFQAGGVRGDTRCAEFTAHRLVCARDDAISRTFRFSPWESHVRPVNLHLRRLHIFPVSDQRARRLSSLETACKSIAAADITTVYQWQWKMIDILTLE